MWSVKGGSRFASAFEVTSLLLCEVPVWVIVGSPIMNIYEEVRFPWSQRGHMHPLNMK